MPGASRNDEGASSVSDDQGGVHLRNCDQPSEALAGGSAAGAGSDTNAIDLNARTGATNARVPEVVVSHGATATAKAARMWLCYSRWLFLRPIALPTRSASHGPGIGGRAYKRIPRPPPPYGFRLGEESRHLEAVDVRVGG